jgi:uncharacterized protein YecA (UPF0149 family)
MKNNTAAVFAALMAFQPPAIEIPRIKLEIPGRPLGSLVAVKYREKRIGRNDPCHCGSGKKFKKCHLNRKENHADH